MPPGSPFWTGVSDLLAPTYLPRDQVKHHRASPGLAPTEALHAMSRVLLVLPGLDSLAAQSEIWVKKLNESGRGDHLQVERYPKMKHGWTQMPDSWLQDEERKLKAEIYDKTIAYVRDIWTDGEGSTIPSKPEDLDSKF